MEILSPWLLLVVLDPSGSVFAATPFNFYQDYDISREDTRLQAN